MLEVNCVLSPPYFYIIHFPSEEMLSRRNAKPLCGVFTENTYNFISFISPVTRYYQQPCTPLAQCEKEKKDEWFAGCAFQKTPRCKIFIHKRRVIPAASGVPLQLWMRQQKEEEEKGEPRGDRRRKALIEWKGQSVPLCSAMEGHWWVSECLPFTEAHWKNPDVHTYCKDGFMFSYSTLGYWEKECIFLLSMYLNCKMCWSPSFLLRRGWRWSQAALQPGEGDCNYKLQWLMASNHI